MWQAAAETSAQYFQSSCCCFSLGFRGLPCACTVQGTAKELGRVYEQIWESLSMATCFIRVTLSHSGCFVSPKPQLPTLTRKTGFCMRSGHPLQGQGVRSEGKPHKDRAHPVPFPLQGQSPQQCLPTTDHSQVAANKSK